MSDDMHKEDAPQPRLEELITVKQADEFGGLSASQNRFLARQGTVCANKLGNNWFTTAQAVNGNLALDHRPGPKQDFERCHRHRLHQIKPTQMSVTKPPVAKRPMEKSLWSRIKDFLGSK